MSQWEPSDLVLGAFSQKYKELKEGYAKDYQVKFLCKIQCSGANNIKDMAIDEYDEIEIKQLDDNDDDFDSDEYKEVLLYDDLQ